jgi:serine/threonine protein kinase
MPRDIQSLLTWDLVSNSVVSSRKRPELYLLEFTLLDTAKYVTDKTYTQCGTPMYIAPEVVNFKGHDKSADHWSWACIVYEMVTGDYAFYEKDMPQLELIARAERGQITIYGWMSLEVKLLLISTLVPDPTQRLGWFDLMESPWFADVDFKELRRQNIKAPWVPKLKNPLDASMFSSDKAHVKDKITAKEPILGESDQQIFNAFGDIIDTPNF